MAAVKGGPKARRAARKSTISLPGSVGQPGTGVICWANPCWGAGSLANQLPLPARRGSTSLSGRNGTFDGIVPALTVSQCHHPVSPRASYQSKANNDLGFMTLSDLTGSILWVPAADI
jgi:hypothetical protein